MVYLAVDRCRLSTWKRILLAVALAWAQPSTFPNQQWGLDTKSRRVPVDTFPPYWAGIYLYILTSLSQCDARAIRAIDSRLTIWRVLNRIARVLLHARRVCTYSYFSLTSVPIRSDATSHIYTHLLFVPITSSVCDLNFLLCSLYFILFFSFSFSPPLVCILLVVYCILVPFIASKGNNVFVN